MPNVFSNTGANTSREISNQVVNLHMYCHEIKRTKAGNALLSCSFSSKNSDDTYTKSISVSIMADPEKINVGALTVPGALKVTGGIKVSEYKSKSGYTVPTLTIFAENVTSIAKKREGAPY